MATMVRTTTIYGQVVIDMNIRCKKCLNLIEWQDGNYGLNEIIIEPCLCINPVELDLPILDKQINDFDEWDGLSGTVRVINCLRSECIETLRDLLQTSKTYLLKTPNLGKRSIVVIDEFVKKLGFILSEGSYSDTSATKYKIRRIGF